MNKPLYLGKLQSTSSRFEMEGDELVTHGVVLGMTGSGKTGLSITLLEELAGQGIPLILIDPKGDLANLELLFPQLRGSDFQPWIDPQEAQRQSRTTAELGEQAATQMRTQLAEWEIQPERVAALREKMDLRVYTPGSRSGLPLNLLGSFDRPQGAEEGSELRTELIGGTVQGLLSLVGVTADPLRSPEHIVLATIIDTSWKEAAELSLETLIMRLVDPPFKKVGVFPVDSFFPPDKRMELAMRLNGLLASSGFAAWTAGEPLQPSRWLTPGAKTPVSIFYLAHLGDNERMFFVSLLLERVLAHVRTLSGSTGLRALVYFDEVAGYLPPHPLNPPSKRPLLTLFKQARAVGVGVVVATQNPVDIDYKGLANAGTWMIGRMQTAQDRERVADGLISAEAGVDRATLIGLFESLKPRLFMVKGPHSNQPQVIMSRQAMSFLRGPLTRSDLERLPKPSESQPAAAPAGVASEVQGSWTSVPGTVPGFASVFVDPRIVFAARFEGLWQKYAEDAAPDGKLRWRPALFGELELRFDEDKGGFVHDERIWRVFFPLDKGLSKTAFSVPFEDADVMDAPAEGGLFQALPTALDESPELKNAQKALVDEVFRNVTDSQFVHSKLKVYGAGGEDREQFEARLKQIIQERIDAQLVKLHEKYDRQVATLQDRIGKKEIEAAQLGNTAQGRQTEQLWSAGAAVLNFFTSNHRSVVSALSKTVGGALTKNRLSDQAKGRVQAAQEELNLLHQKLEALQNQLETEVEAITSKEMQALSDIEERTIRLETSDIRLSRFGVLWVPLSRRI